MYRSKHTETTQLGGEQLQVITEVLRLVLLVHDKLQARATHPFDHENWTHYRFDSQLYEVLNGRCIASESYAAVQTLLEVGGQHLQVIGQSATLLKAARTS